MTKKWLDEKGDYLKWYNSGNTYEGKNTLVAYLRSTAEEREDSTFDHMETHRYTGKGSWRTEYVTLDTGPVSYTHLDVYKRQQQSNLYAEAYGKYDMSYMEGKTQDLYTRLGNAILKEVKWYETQISKRIEREEISSKEKEEMKEEKKEQVKDDAFPGKRMVPEEPEKEKVAEEKTEDQRYATAKSLLKWGEEEDVKKGIRYLTELASEGHEAARVKLGCEFLKGEHVPRNVEMAREYLIKAAEQGNEFSKGMLIQLSETGRAGSKRYAMADLDWALYKMQKSMEQEHVHTYKILRQYELEQDMEFDREYSL